VGLRLFRFDTDEIVENIWKKIEFLLRKFADDRITLISKTKSLVLIASILGTALLLIGILTWHANFVNSAGVLFDIAGALLLFVREEWQEIVAGLDIYADEEKYPYGPPSHITRILSEHDERNESDYEVNGLGPHYFNNRAILLLVLGFLFQLTANFM
jgi:hypothetical protein